ncbi:hypothetical protein Unana1_01331 [Umbelopsis nana]
MQEIESPARPSEHLDSNMENTAPRTAESFSQQFYSPISPLDKLSTSNKLSNMKRLSSPNLWRIRDSQPLRTVENSTSPFLATHSTVLAEAEKKSEKKLIERSLTTAAEPTTKAVDLPAQKSKIEPETKSVTRQVDAPRVSTKAKTSSPPVPSYMRFTEAYKRSKGLLSADEERQLPHHRRDNSANKKSERINNAKDRHSTKSLLGPKAEGVNKRRTVSHPFHFHSTLRSTVIQEIKDNENDTDEPFVPLAVRIKQFEENIAGRGYNHTSKDNDSKPSAGDAATPKHIIPRSPKLLTKIRHENGHNFTNDTKVDTQKTSITDKEYKRDYERSTASSLNHLKRKRDEISNDEHDKRPRGASEVSTKKKASSRFTPTIPQPFSFQTDQRGQHYQEQFQAKLQMWRKLDQDTNNEIHAKPAPNYPPPMAIKRSVKPLTAAQNLVLHSDIRALERKTANDDKKIKEKLAVIEQESRERRLHRTSIKGQLPLPEARSA